MANENHFCSYCGAAVGALDCECIVCKNPIQSDQGTAAPPRENPEASEAGGAGAEPHPPLSPQTIQYPSISLANAIRRHLKQRGIWQTIEGRFAVNDEVKAGTKGYAEVQDRGEVLVRSVKVCKMQQYMTG